MVQGTNVIVAEVCFYFRITVGTQDLTLAYVSCYSQLHEGLLQASQGTLWFCTQGVTKVINVKSISAVVAIVPHHPFPGEERLFLVKKPGLDSTN
jgi:hypothetical protein